MMIPICNEGLASQQRPNGCGKAAGGRPQSRISPMELSKPKSGKEHAGEDSSCHPSPMWLRGKLRKLTDGQYAPEPRRL